MFLIKIKIIVSIYNFAIVNIKQLFTTFNYLHYYTVDGNVSTK